MVFELEKKDRKTEEKWNILFDQIVKGNVIPVIGPEMIHIDDMTSSQFLLTQVGRMCGVDVEREDIHSFSELIFDKRYDKDELGNIHTLLYDIIKRNAGYFHQEKNNRLLKRFLEIKHFPFVITTVFDPVIENLMHDIHGESLRVMNFCNDPSRNQDIRNGEDIKKPTLYYMFGKIQRKQNSFVVTDGDLLRFSQSWMRPNDYSATAKPATLASVLAHKYLLVLGYGYQDWLIRFFWYAMKNESFDQERCGMFTQTKEDKKLIEFLTRAKAFATVEPNTEAFVNKLYEGIEEVEKRGVEEDRNSHAIPQEGTDVFISYSRGDSQIVDELCEILKSKGLNVWYDRINLHKGTDFMRQIENAIRHSRFFVPVLTKTIIEQAKEEHTYRLEWDFAVSHIRHIGGVSYCSPFYEKDFDMDNILAGIPNDLKRHDAFPFTHETFRSDAEKMANYIFNEIQRR